MAVHFSVQGFVGQSEYAVVVPEGGDDLELRASGSRVLAQVKSRRDHLGPFTVYAAAAFIKKMWDAKDVTNDDHFILVLESNVGERRSSVAQFQELSAYPAVVAKLKGHKSLAAIVARTKILVLPDPRSSAIDLISAWQSCTPFEAEIYVADLLGLVGRISDDNGMRAPGTFRDIARSDVQQRLDALQPLLTSTIVEEALLAGYCEAVDFLTPDEDPLFYLGVDAQASHVAAGLVVERPELRSAVLAGLEGRHNVLIHGASGSGKSAVLWEAAYASRHAVRWFQIRHLPMSAMQPLLQLARSRRATADAPVGFIIDDVGRGFSDGWTAMAFEVGRTPGLLLLASVREEDKYPLADSRRAIQVKVQGDNVLAERVWRELRDRGQTSWQGWKEPWKLSKGHLLEYTHALTQGRRLSETLHAQISTRMNNVTRHDELDVLRAVACANATGCSAEIAQLPQILGKLPSVISHALTRLKDEHLVQDTSDGRIVGLHELRSTELLRLAHEFPPPLLSATAATTVWLVPVGELARFLARILSKHDKCDEAVLQSLALRLEANPSAALFNSIITGLDHANAYRIIFLWRGTPEAQAVAKSVQGTPASLAIGDIEPPDIGPTVPATRRFTEIRSEVLATGLTACFLALLSQIVLRRVLESSSKIGDLTSCLVAMLGQTMPPKHRAEFVRLTPPLVNANFQDVVALLEVAARVDRSLAIGWVDAVGQHAMFQRFSEHVAWADAPSMSPCEEGLEVRANVWYVASSVQTDLNMEVVRTCEMLLALAPTADVVSSVALGADGIVISFMTGGHPLVQKRMSRKNVPCLAQVVRNRAWIAILNAQLATESYTAYLAECLELVRLVNRNLKLLLDGRLRGKTDTAAVEALGHIYDSSQALFAPQEPQSVSQSERWSRLQSILSSCSLDLIVRFFALPDGALAYLGWIKDLLKSISVAQVEESWEVLSLESPKELDELFRIIEALQALAGEAYVRGRSPFLTHLRKTAAKGSSFDKAGHAARQYHDTEFKALEAKLRTKLCSVSEGIGVYLLADAEISTLWPPADVLITVPVTADGTTVVLVDSWPVWRASVDQGRKICILPVMQSFGLTNLAISGFDTLMPVLTPEKVQVWCSTAGVGVAPLDSVNAFTRLTNSLVELQNIHAYWKGKDGRTPEEKQIYQTLLGALDNARADWSNLGLPDGLKDAVLTLIEAGLHGEFPLADATAKLLHGERTSTIEMLEMILVNLTEFDYFLGVPSPHNYPD
ncbi:ATP-binding protein [Janthinobacterium sp. 35]|uniref:ATP-binding protein n=1 Tax=Janthinobacterium sp. 35 TaxID=2035210 RepID=UPI00117A2D02|nr:ATP-binding protein [Janthinobacterium sp. 35]